MPPKETPTDQPVHLGSIDDVIAALEEIIKRSVAAGDPLGYFAVLYQKVTIKVKEGIDQDFFDKGPRMEQLDIVFAKRYIDAYYAYRQGEPVTASWEKAFTLATSYWPLVLQHLLMGINAHINLDLGIAAAEISKDKRIEDLEGDFNRINDILSALVNDVQQDLSYIWPFLRWILRKTGKLDDLLVDFSMKIARDGAWKFAGSIFGRSPEALDQLIVARDEKVARKSGIIIRPGRVGTFILRIIRLGERGSVADKIDYLRN